MTRITGWTCLLAVVGLACADAGDPLPLGPGSPMASQHHDPGSSCFTPEFTVHLVPLGGVVFGGAVTGDLEGTVTMEFDIPGSLRFAGVTIKNEGIADWEVTGGVIPGLGSFRTEFRNMNLDTDRPGSPPTTFENIGSHRVLSGVAKANLTYKGTFDVTPTPSAVHRYRGVICP